MAKVSVIIPIYNTAQYLRQCLDSVINQTERDLEIILVSNGPEEDDNICLEYAAKDNRIKFFKNPIKAPGVSRNIGLDNATSPYIAFLDSDDWIKPETYEHTLKYIEDNDLVCWDIDNVIEDKTRNVEVLLCCHSLKYEGKTLVDSDFRLKNYFIVWNKLFKKEIIDKYNIRFAEKYYHEDVAFFFCYSAVAENVYCIKNKYSMYRIRKNSICENRKKETKKSLSTYIYVIKNIYNFLLENNLLKKDNVFFQYFILSIVKFSFVDKADINYIDYLKKINEAITKMDFDCSENCILQTIKDEKYRTAINMINKDINKYSFTKEKLTLFINKIFMKLKLKICSLFNIEIASDNPKVSVVMPTLNSEKFLKDAMDSIIFQTFTDFEFIIVDDNSTDNTLGIINSYNDKRIKVINGDNKGIAAARQKGNNNAKGEYIAIMDSDDISMPNRFKKQVKFLDNNKNVSILSSYVKEIGIHHYTHELPLLHNDIKNSMICYATTIFNQTIMMRKNDIYNNNILYNIKSPMESYEFLIDAVHKLEFANLQEILGLHRMHSSNNSLKNEHIFYNYKEYLKAKQLKDYLKIDIDETDYDLLRTDFKIYNMLNHEQREVYKNRLKVLHNKIIEQNNIYKVYDDMSLKYFLENIFNDMCFGNYPPKKKNKKNKKKRKIINIIKMAIKKIILYKWKY